MFSPLLACTLLACGGDEDKPGVTYPSEGEVRAYYGLTPGSCYMYRYLEGGVSKKLTDTITRSADEGEGAVQRRRVYLTGGGFSDEFYYQADDAGKLRLLKARLGSTPETRKTYRYPADQAPAMLGRQISPSGDPGFSEQQAQLVVTPEVCADGQTDCPAGEREDHKWSRLNQSEVQLPGQSEKVPAEKLRYRVQRGGESRTEDYWLVPNYGFVKIEVGEIVYSLCEARVCNAEGKECKGADSCKNLKCP